MARALSAMRLNARTQRTIGWNLAGLLRSFLFCKQLVNLLPSSDLFPSGMRAIEQFSRDMPTDFRFFGRCKLQRFNDGRNVFPIVETIAAIRKRFTTYPSTFTFTLSGWKYRSLGKFLAEIKQNLHRIGIFVLYFPHDEFPQIARCVEQIGNG